MSRHLASTTLRGRPVEVVAGFDRRLGEYFLQVISRRGKMLYSDLEDPGLDWTKLNTLRTRIWDLGLALPESLITEVEADGLCHAGNRVRHHADGPPVTLLNG